MPPKSSNKKKIVSWFLCEKCNVHITSSKDREIHEKFCPIGQDECNNNGLEFIRNDILYTSTLERKTFSVEELADSTQKCLNNLIFLSEGAMKLCRFRIGQNVVIRSLEQPQLPPLVRAMWPIPEKFLTTVFVSPDDYRINWQNYKGTLLKIEKIPSSQICIAKHIELKVNHGQHLDPSQWRDVERVLKNQMKNCFYARGSIVRLNFFNRLLELTILRLSSSFPSESDSFSLEKELEKMQLNEDGKFFQIILSTHFEIMNSINLDTKSDDKPITIIKTDIGGLEEQLKIVEESMNIALGVQHIPTGVSISRGLLLFGPTGCGKSMICEAMACSTNAKVIRINASELFSKFLGETEKNLQEHFERAYRNYPNSTLIIVEDVHNLCPKHETNEVVKRVSVAFLNMLDSLNLHYQAKKIFVLATTGNIEELSAGIRRPGRIDCEVEVPAPAPKDRCNIMKCLLKRVEHNLTDESISEISNVTHGFVGSDIANLIYNASLTAVKARRSHVELSDLSEALHHVKPSAMREVLIENPNVKWSDIGGQQCLKLKLKQAIEWPLLHSEKFERLGIKAPRGILMFGPPGCSKTMIAKALATESQVNFLSIKGPELFSMWVGESERAVREIFRKARQVSPSIIFFDEIDAIGGERSSDSGSSVKERVLTQLLTELDGVDALKNVTIVAATNRPDMIDKALLRPGRIDRIVYVGLPNAEARKEIFHIKLRKMPLASDVDIDRLIELTEGYSGAEIQAVCHEAALKSLEESFEAEAVRWSEFEYALQAVHPRTSSELLKLYDQFIKHN